MIVILTSTYQTTPLPPTHGPTSPQLSLTVYNFQETYTQIYV